MMFNMAYFKPNPAQLSQQTSKSKPSPGDGESNEKHKIEILDKNEIY